MRGLSGNTKTLIEYAYRILQVDHPMTLRQLHYAIFSRKEIGYENSQPAYKRLSRATTVARRAHRAWELSADDVAQPAFSIPSRWMVDETREGQRVSLWTDKDEFIVPSDDHAGCGENEHVQMGHDQRGYLRSDSAVETVKRAYRRDNWQDQENYVEVWSEKATVLGSVRPIADKYGITLRVCHGFGSTGMESDVGSTFESLDKDITVFYLGDHDPSGHVIEEDIHRRAQLASGVTFRMVRLAIHPADIAKFKLPPQTIKKSDSRAASFQKRFGKMAKTVELDALPAAELRDRIEAAVSGLIEFETWNRQVQIQQVELQCIRDFADRVKNLPQISPEVRP